MAFLAIIIATAAIYMPMLEAFPVNWSYYHYFIRKPINWTIFIALLLWSLFLYLQNNQFPMQAIAPIIIAGIAVVLAYKMHQESSFKAVDFPEMAGDIEKLPIHDEMQLAIIEYNGVTKCYPLDYVIHHHIINDKFNSKTVALTYCAMCRSIIPFDVTEIGPLFVGSFKGANLIVADKKTKTFFQQATFKSIIGKLHPYELSMVPFQILSWPDVKKTIDKPKVVAVTKEDFREFQLPIPGLWKKISSSESTPGLSSKNKDKTFPARTRVIGVTDKSIKCELVYLKKEVISNLIVINKECNFFLIGISDTVNGFKNTVNNIDLKITMDHTEIIDLNSKTHWDIRGKYLKGALNTNLEPIAISDEYWFSWRKHHNSSKLIRL